MRFDIGIRGTQPVPTIVEQVRLAEALGYDTVWITDTHPLCRELWVTLTACALATSRIRLGPGITVPHTRHAAVRAAIHGHLRSDLTCSGQVGWTHWEQDQAAEPPPGVAPTFFSSLEHIRRRNTEWGGAEFEPRFDAAWQAFLAASQGWFRIVHERGRETVEQTYEAVLKGLVRPEDGHILSG